MLAVAGVTVAITQVEDPLVFAGALVLLWAALRFGPAAVAWSGLALVAAADWSAARLTGPFVDLATTRDAVVVLQTYAAITLFTTIALALAFQERDIAEAGRAAAAERFRRTFHDSPVAMAVTTIEGRIVETNRALCQLVAMPDHALVGTELRALWPDDSGEHELSRPDDPGSAAARGPPGERARQRRVRRDQRVSRCDGATPPARCRWSCCAT